MMGPRVRPHVALRAAIFDVDGVLVQSMEKHHIAYQRAFEPLGILIEAREVFANEGRRSREVIESLAKAHGLPLGAAELDAMNKVKQHTFASFGPMPRYPGVDALIDRLHARGLKLAMVTGTARVNVENHLSDLLHKFEAVVTADDVRHTKPHPEPYLAALAKLDVEPDDAVVVENAPLGIRSAKAAGMRVIAVTSTNPVDALKEADVIVSRVADVEGAL